MHHDNTSAAIDPTITWDSLAQKLHLAEDEQFLQEGKINSEYQILLNKHKSLVSSWREDE